MTMDPDERTKLQSVRMMLAQSGGVVVALTIPTFSNILVATTARVSEPLRSRWHHGYPLFYPYLR